jgi:hypothetical protein
LLLVALAATFGLGRARLSGHRVAVGLLTASCLMPLLTAAALSGFSWRYQLPQLALLPTAAALGIWALLRGRQGGPEPSPPLRVLDRAAAWIGRLPLPRAWRPAYDRAVTRGWPQVALGLLAATVGGLLVHLLAMASGWAAPRTAAALGVLAGTAALVMLLVAWRRSAADAVP